MTGWLTNTAIITSEVTDYRPDNNAYTVTTWIRPPLADVGIAKSGPASVNAGSELTYTIVFSNTGEIDAANVIITDTLPLSVTFVRGTEAYSFSQPVSGTLVWMTDSVPIGGQPFSLTVVVDAAPDAAGWLTNQVTITTTTNETVVANNTATFTTQVTTQSADLSVDKSGPISVTAGAEITYTIIAQQRRAVDGHGRARHRHAADQRHVRAAVCAVHLHARRSRPHVECGRCAVPPLRRSVGR